MNKELQKKVEQWMSLERKTLEQRQKADAFYDAELMALICDEFIQNNAQSVFETVDYLVVSVGTSYEPIVLDISLLKPKKLLFLYTEKSEKTLNKIVDFCDLQPTDYEKRMVNEIDPMDIYREVKRIYLKWKRPDRMYIDFTGGTKAMSAACALAGAMVDIQMVYVSTNDYLVDFRKPNPGSEELTYIENPIAVFGDLEVDKALELMDKYNFAGAADKLESIKEKIPDPEIRQQLNFVYTLAKAYEAWDALDFEPAYQQMLLLHKQIMRDGRLHPEYLMVDFKEKIGVQRQYLEQLNRIPELQKQKKQAEILKSDEMIHALMFTMFQNARTREEQEKYDMATLLLYRLLEMIEQRRLMNYNLYASKPEYSKIRYDLQRCPVYQDLSESERLNTLKDRLADIKIQIFRTSDTYLPNQIALLDGFLILTALGDPITEGHTHNAINTLKQIRNMVSLRNNSIFAHGLGPVGVEDYLRFRKFVEQMFRDFCRIEGVDFDTCTEHMAWLNPKQSRNSLTGWEA